MKDSSDGPDPSRLYWVLKPFHGEMDLLSIDEQWETLGNPEIPEEIKASCIEDLQLAARNRFQLKELLGALLALGDQPDFIINDLGVEDGDWSKFRAPDSISLRKLMSVPLFHFDHWYRIVG